MKIHMIGIGGSGMSALAKYYVKKGHSLSGSDQAKTDVTEKLEKLGVKIFHTHQKENVDSDIDLLVYSRAISADNPEMQFAEENNIKALTYFEAMGEALEKYELVAVAGTHGKTTTTALLGLAMIKNDLDPTVFVGSCVPQFEGENVIVGNSNWAVAEACEYKGNFFGLKPKHIIIVSLDHDHPDTYPTEESYLKAFEKFVGQLSSESNLVLPYGNKMTEKLEDKTEAKVSYFSAQDLPAEINLKIKGEHNRSNAAAVWKFLEIIGANDKKTIEAMEKYTGTQRRFEVIGEKMGATFISDYAHHPTEIKATLKTAREVYPDKKIIAVFQPHQFSRTRVFLDDFKEALKEADEALVSDIYFARDTEEDVSAVSAKDFESDGIKYSGDLEKTAEVIKSDLTEDCVVILMGAGNIPEVYNLI